MFMDANHCRESGRSSASSQYVKPEQLIDISQSRHPIEQLIDISHSRRPIEQLIDLSQSRHPTDIH